MLSGVTNPPAILVRKYRLDWWLHGIEYGILAVLMMKYFSYRHFIGRPLVAATTTILFCGVVGGLNEGFQSFIPRRFPSFGDEIANIVGATVFIAVYLSIRSLTTVKNQSNN